MVNLILVLLLADGHILIEGVPGVAKTLTAKLVARSLDAGFSRAGFTPGTYAFRMGKACGIQSKEPTFDFKKGPAFARNTILVDEINRAPAKTQSALLEIMEEAAGDHLMVRHIQWKRCSWCSLPEPARTGRHVSLCQRHSLDRFLFKIVVPYPNEGRTGYPNPDSGSRRGRPPRPISSPGQPLLDGSGSTGRTLTTAATKKQRAPRVITEATMNIRKNWARPEAIATSL